MSDEKIDFDQQTIYEWRDLGFHYDQDDNCGSPKWRFHGSKVGLNNFALLLDEYVSNPNNDSISEHQHYGPYNYLKIMTWDKPIITEEYIAGTINDLKSLRQLFVDKLANARSGESFDIHKEYGLGNTIGCTFFVTADDFDPASMDK